MLAGKVLASVGPGEHGSHRADRGHEGHLAKACHPTEVKSGAQDHRDLEVTRLTQRQNLAQNPISQL